MSRRYESWHMYQEVTPQIQITHVTHVNVSCHIEMRLGTGTKSDDSFGCVCATSHMLLCDATRTRNSTRTRECRLHVHIRMSRITRVNKSRHTYTKGMPQISVRHITCECVMSLSNESWHTCEEVTPQIRLSRITLVNVPCHIGMSHGTHTKE